jgi:hypothetical protein
MRGKLTFVAGAGIGYLLGTRAGRERFDQITAKARRFWDSKTVQDAAGTVQEQAGRLYEGGKQMMSDQSHRMREKNNRKHPQQEAQEHREAAWEAPVGFPVNASY